MPKIINCYTKLSCSENDYVNDGFKFNAATLIQFAKEKGYEVFDMPLAGILLDEMPFKIDNLDDFIWQCYRMNNTDLSYPILIDSRGRICDGYHRVCKAILNGDTTIKAIRLEEMPNPTGKDETK